MDFINNITGNIPFNMGGNSNVRVNNNNIQQVYSNQNESESEEETEEEEQLRIYYKEKRDNLISNLNLFQYKNSSKFLNRKDE
jgi:hypothetical protein